MKTVYKLSTSARCPKGGRDQYEVVVEAVGMIEVEELIKIVDEAVAEPRFQEEITLRIAAGLGPVSSCPSGGTVTLRGWHSGVETTSTKEFGP